MIKKFFIFLILLLVSLGAFFFNEYSNKRTVITPYPYYFNGINDSKATKELALAENAKILIMGDMMGEALSKYTPDIMDDLAKNYKYPPTIYNWSKAHEGLHRTLNKLKSLKKIPTIIIYHGASSELYEQTFAVTDKDSIFKNFSLFDDEKLISLIITFPWLSKIFYKKMDYFEIGAIKEYKNVLPGNLKLDEKEISFKIFDYELKELIEFAHDHKSHLILLTTPLNLELRPKEICSNTTSKDIVDLQNEIEELLKIGNYKQAYPKALALSEATVSNALSFYLLGKAAMGLGNLAEARSSLAKSSVFDCSNWRGNAVLNAIIKKNALKYQLPLIDFDMDLSSALSKDGLFIDEIFPQSMFYQTMISELKNNLKKILSIN